MSTLTIDALTPSGTPGKMHFLITTCDVNGDPAPGYDGDGVIVAPYEGTTDSDGHAEVDLTPSADLDPANLCYRLEIGSDTFILVKGAGEETVAEALAGSLDALGGVLGIGNLIDVSLTDDLAAGRVLVVGADGSTIEDADSETLAGVQARTSPHALPATLGTFGDSRLDYGSLGEGGTGRRFITGRVASMLGVHPARIRHHAVAGSTARWGNWRTFQRFNPGRRGWPYRPKIGLVVGSHGSNDLTEGLGTGSPSWQRASTIAGLIAEITRWRASDVVESSSSELTYTGSWTTVLYSSEAGATWTGSGTSYRKTTSAGAKVTWTTPPDLGKDAAGVWITPQFICSDTGATGSIWVDGVKVADIDVGLGAAAGTAYSHGQGDDVYRRTVAGTRFYLPTSYVAGTNTVEQHTVEIRFGATVGASSVGLRFSHIDIEAHPEVPLVCLLNVVQIANNRTGLSGSMLDPATHDEANEWLAEVAAEFTDGAVIIADIDTALGGNTGVWTEGTGSAYGSNRAYFLGDGTHTNDAGSKRAAETIRQAIADALQDGDLAGRVTLLGCDPDELDPLLATPVLHVGAGTPVTVLDDFERTPSDIAPGGDWTVHTGTHGIDSQGQLFLSDALFAAPDVLDSFTRDDEALGLVEWDVDGEPRSWAQTNGTWAVVSGKAKCTAKAASGHNLALVEVGATTQTIEATITGNGEFARRQGLVLRYVDASNYLYYGYLSTGSALIKVVGGVETTVLSVPGYSQPHIEVGADDVVHLWTASTGAYVGSYTITDAVLQHGGTGTKAGLWVSSAASVTTPATFDNVRIGSTRSSDDAVTQTRSMATLDTGSADGYIGLELGAYVDGGFDEQLQGSGLLLRYVDALNYYRLESSLYGFWTLKKVVAGTATTIATWYTGYGAGIEVGVLMSGASFSLYKNETLVNRYDGGSTSVTDATHTSDLHGVQYPYVNTVAKSRWRAILSGEAVTGSDVARGDWFADTGTAGTVTLYGPHDGTEFGDGVSMAADDHDHAIADVTGLQTALDGKAATAHSHAQSDVTGLTGALAVLSATDAALANGQLILSAAFYS